MDKQHIVELSNSWIHKMFGSTQYLFGIHTTWQYMLFSLVAFYIVLLIINIISRLFQYEFRILRILIKLLSYVTYFVLATGTVFYFMVLFKKMWSFA